MHLEITPIFVVVGRQKRLLRCCHNQIHGSYITRSFFNYLDCFSKPGQGAEARKSIGVVENLLGSYTARLPDSNPGQLAIKNEHSVPVGKRHIIFNPDAFVAKRTAGMSQKKTRIVEPV